MSEINDKVKEDNKINYDIGIFDSEGKNSNPLNGKPYSDTYKTLAQFWSSLPAFSMAKNITESIKNHDVILLQSATGSGKSVIGPKLCLHVNDYKGLVVMTLPKKLVTLTAAEFSAKTLDVELGEQVGYAFRGDSMKSDETVLLYCTDGLVVSIMKNDPMIKNIDILIIDEAHERKVQIDLLLYLVKNAIKIRKERNMKPLKLVIMSATINESIFRAYYRDFAYDYLFLSGKPNYPIESIYLEAPLNIKSNQYLEEGKNLILNIVNKINSGDKKFTEGDILFFVCTVSECVKTTLVISELIKDAFVMALYSGFDSELEPYVSNPMKYKELDSNYKRRIFVSTNVAESSLTIDGLCYVVDSGLAMSVVYDPVKKFNVMGKNMITRAQISQRKGRAGRTQSGMCFHLYTPEQELSSKEFPDPEILREDMKNICLSLMKLGCQINKTDFTMGETIKMFTDFIEPPLESFITDGFDYALSNGLIVDNLLSKKGRLIIASRLDVGDGLTLLYAWNIDDDAFKSVFKIICIQSLLKHGVSDFFHGNISDKKKDKIIKKLISGCANSEHLLLEKMYKYIEENKNAGLFNIKLFNAVTKLYDSQIEKMEKVFKKSDIKIESIIKKDMNYNMICAFNYGLKTNRAFKSGGKYKYNGVTCDLSKCAFNYGKYSSIVFYSNLYMSGKLNVSIVSPWLLD
jgi:HrpA-like RNA helicase